jgi:hypothetical protein
MSDLSVDKIADTFSRAELLDLIRKMANGVGDGEGVAVYTYFDASAEEVELIDAIYREYDGK